MSGTISHSFLLRSDNATLDHSVLPAQKRRIGGGGGGGMVPRAQTGRQRGAHRDARSRARGESSAPSPSSFSPSKANLGISRWMQSEGRAECGWASENGSDKQRGRLGGAASPWLMDGWIAAEVCWGDRGAQQMNKIRSEEGEGKSFFLGILCVMRCIGSKKAWNCRSHDRGRRE